jgi:hypothetical protein
MCRSCVALAQHMPCTCPLRPVSTAQIQGTRNCVGACVCSRGGTSSSRGRRAKARKPRRALQIKGIGVGLGSLQHLRPSARRPIPPTWRSTPSRPSSDYDAGEIATRRRRGRITIAETTRAGRRRDGEHPAASLSTQTPAIARTHGRFPDGGRVRVSSRNLGHRDAASTGDEHHENSRPTLYVLCGGDRRATVLPLSRSRRAGNGATTTSSDPPTPRTSGRRASVFGSGMGDTRQYAPDIK